MHTMVTKQELKRSDKHPKKYKCKPIIAKTVKNHPLSTDSQLGKQILSPKHCKIDAKLKISSKEGEKAEKKLKKNKIIKDFCIGSQCTDIKFDSKTQKFQFFQVAENTKTVRKTNLTERKHCPHQYSQLSDRSKLGQHNRNSKNIIKQQKITQGVEKVVQAKNLSIPSKNKKNLKKSKTMSTDREQTKRRKHFIVEKNFLLMGDKFLVMNQEQVSKLKEQMKRQQDISLKYSNFCESDLRMREEFYSSAVSQEEIIGVENQDNARSSIDSDQCKMFSNSKTDKFPKFLQIQQKNEQQKKQVKCQPIFSNYSQTSGAELSSIQGTPKQQKLDNLESEQCKDMIQVRIRAIHVQMKTNTQFLQNLLKNNKISQPDYQKYLDLVMIKYDRQITAAQHLKQLVSENNSKIQSLVTETRSIMNYTEEIFKGHLQLDESVKDTLIHIFGNLPEPDSAQTHQEKDLLTFQEPDKFQETMYPELVINNRSFIEERISQQIGLKKTPFKPLLNTSVLGIFQFLKCFYGFLLNNYTQQLLKYMNMPYGYSIEQRLLYMQGYDEDLNESEENEIGVIYGIEEVLSPQIFQKYYESLEASQETQKMKYEKIHNKAIFDGINESLNEYRPYFFLNGPPYPWTFSEKTLTFFFVSQENIEQVLEKVQFQILKWSSCLCGLIVPNLTNQDGSAYENTEQLQINEIFSRYTNNVDESLIQERQQKAIKAQKQEIESKNYEWLMQQEQKTAVLLQLSSIILEQISNETAILLFERKFLRKGGISFNSLL